MAELEQINNIMSLLICFFKKKDVFTKLEITLVGLIVGLFSWPMHIWIDQEQTSGYSFTPPIWSLTGCRLMNVSSSWSWLIDHFFQDNSAVHIAEETLNGAWAAPASNVVGALGAGILGWLMSIAVSFTTASVVEALQSNHVLQIGGVF